MSFRHSNAGITGSNNIPLGNRRRFGQEDEGEQRSPSNGSVGFKRGRSRERSDVLAAADAGPRPRKKKNRWGAEGENKAAGLIGIPTAIIAPMTTEQLDAYVMNMRIEEISAKIRINDVVPKDGERSPSPPPQYDNQGKRVNTREYRYKKRLEDERHKLVEKALKTIPNYKPPSEYRRPTKTQEKVYVPVNDYPELNFIGLLIGPRGNTLKKMESESGAKIAIRGKGSVKEGKGKSDAAHASNQEEDLHCLIMADTEAKINKAKELIHNVIETAASIPEGQNELKRNQLRELAALNGTLRDDENQACQNCGEIGHRKYDCPNKANYTANIVCRVCGNSGHMARDCPDRPAGGYRGNDRGGFGGRGRIGAPATQDDEYERLMASITDGGAIGTAGGAQRIEGGAGFGNDAYGAGAGDAQKPWERNAPMAAAPWRQSNPQDDQRNSGPAPWRNNQDNFGNGRGAAPWNSGRGSGGGGGGGGGGGYGSGRGGRGGYNEHDSGNARPWAQGGDRYNANHAYNNNNNSYNANGYNYGYGNGGGGNGYDNTGSGGAAPWAQQGGSAPWATSYNAPGQDAPPPPPPGDFAPPPPPPSGSVPPPPPPSEKPPPPPPPGL